MNAPQPRLLLGYTVPDHVRWSAFGRAIDISCLKDACKQSGAAKRFLVPALGEATDAIDWLKAHAHGADVAEPASGPADRLRAVVQDVLDDLKDGACTFWACPGPDAPFTPMATCRVCASVMDLRAALDGSPLPSEEPGHDRV